MEAGRRVKPCGSTPLLSSEDAGRGGQRGLKPRARSGVVVRIRRPRPRKVKARWWATGLESRGRESVAVRLGLLPPWRAIAARAAARLLSGAHESVAFDSPALRQAPALGSDRPLVAAATRIDTGRGLRPSRGNAGMHVRSPTLGSFLPKTRVMDRDSGKKSKSRCKRSVYVSKVMLDEMQREARRLGVPVSRVVQMAWERVRERFRGLRED